MNESPIQVVECDGCADEVELREDGTYPLHGNSVFDGELCARSGKRYAFHAGTFWCSKRDENGIGTEWTAKCRCGETFTGPEYDAVEAPWAQHNLAMKAQVSA